MNAASLHQLNHFYAEHHHRHYYRHQHQQHHHHYQHHPNTVMLINSNIIQHYGATVRTRARAIGSSNEADIDTSSVLLLQILPLHVNRKNFGSSLNLLWRILPACQLASYHHLESSKKQNVADIFLVKCQ